MPSVITGDGTPIEVGAGRGDLRYGSVPSIWGADGPFLHGRPISFARIFATQQWVAIAVMRLLTWSVRVPLKAYRRIDDDKAQRLNPADHPLARAIVDPWERGTAAELVSALLGPLLVHGNSLTDVQQGRNDQIRFKAVDWRYVLPVPVDVNDPDSDIVGWQDYRGVIDEPRRYSAADIMHLRWWSPLGQLGVSPLQQIRDTIHGEHAAIRWTLNNLANAARPAGVVEMSDQFLELDQPKRQALLDQTRDGMREAYGGYEKAGLLPVLPPGLKWSAAKHTTAVEAELMALRQVHRNEVAAIYMVPPPMIGQLDKSSYNNITTQREMAYTDGLAPPLVLIEQKINAHIVRGLLGQDDVFVEFDFAGVLRGDRLKEIQALRESISSALMSPNEARRVLNLPRDESENADKLWLPRNNLQPIDADMPVKGQRGSANGTNGAAKQSVPTVNGAH